MKSIVPALALALLTSAAPGELVITEVMASSLHTKYVSPTPDADGDWWELTNTGTASVNLTNYQWDDIPTPLTPTVSNFPAGVTIQPGESIIILEEAAENVATWRSAWGLSTATQVINRTQFSNAGGEGFSGLGTSGDEINLYDASGKLVSHVEFGASTAGISQALQRDGTPIYGLHSVAAKHGAYSSIQFPSDVGSPGDAKIHFTTAPVIFGKSGYNYAITAVRAGAAAPTISATGLPAFLTLTPGTGGTATLANNRALTLADAGDYLVRITATSGTSTIQEFLLTILNPSPSVILNEYNAVAAANFLNGGDAFTDDDSGDASTDPYFGRTPWNGGQWVEFVVLGDGGTGTLDMRGWSVEIGTNEGSGFIPGNILVLSEDSNWQAVPSRTILTFIDRTSAQGGCDSGFALRDRSATVGDTWTNIWMGDPTYLNYTDLATNGYSTNGSDVSGILIDNNNTQFRLKNSAGQVVFGPVGEGIAPRAGISGKEIFELEGHPTIFVAPNVESTATTQGYSDGASESTFGFPNTWLLGTTVTAQDFSPDLTPEITVEQPAGTNLNNGASQSFGRIVTATSVSRTFTVRNDGTGDLTDLGITVDGTNAADFTITAAATAPVAPTGTTTFTVKFAPTTAGTKNAILHIANNDADEAPFDLNLNGQAYVLVPEIGIQQPVGKELKDGLSTITFAPVVVGKVGSNYVFTIKNSGLGKLTGLVLTKNGTHSKDFVVSILSRTSLSADGSTTFKVTFKPTKKGTRTAAIHLKSNDANENPFDIKLTGTAK